MWQPEFLWFFTIFYHEFRKNNAIAFEVLMVLAVAHVFGFYNPKQLADFLEVPHQQFYTELKDWSVYHVKKRVCPISSPCPSRVTGGQDRRVLVGSYSKMLYLQKKATLGMHVIKKKTLDAYAAQYPDTAEPLRSWRKL